MAPTCEIPSCPAIPKLGHRFCVLHIHARQALMLGLTGAAKGSGAKHCVLCRQAFKGSDWVLLQRQRRLLTASGRKAKADPIGYVHVFCVPRVRKVSKKKLRETVKPLLAGL